MITKLPSLNSIAARLRFRQLRLLIAIDECGSLHRAAEEVSMTQPGATKALQEIETTFGLQLFVRSKLGIEPNEIGRCVIRYARLFQSDLNHLHKEIAGSLIGEGGRLSLGAVTGALPTLVVRATAAVRRQHPTLSIELREDTSVGLLNELRNGRLDIAICRHSAAIQPRHFDHITLREEEAAVVVGPNHHLIGKQKVTWQELSELPWICYPSPLPLRRLLERGFQEAGVPFPSYPVETSSMFASLLLLQEDSTLVTLMSAETMKLYERHRLVFPLQMPVLSHADPYSIVTRRGWSLSPAAGILVSELQKQNDCLLPSMTEQH